MNQPRTRFLCSCVRNASIDHKVHLLISQHRQLNMQRSDEELDFLVKITLAAGTLFPTFTGHFKN